MAYFFFCLTAFFFFALGLSFTTPAVTSTEMNPCYRFHVFTFEFSEPLREIHTSAS
jgi:hypothetical protein